MTVAEPGEEPELGSESDGTVGWWLATRSASEQLGILVAALDLLVKITAATEDTTGVAVPAPIHTVTDLCFALVVFLLLLISKQGKRD
jgi:hypothetical protein